MRRAVFPSLPVLAGWLAAAALSAQAQEAPPQVPPAAAPAFQLDLDSLSATRTLPLFTPSRSAPVSEPAVPEYATPAPAAAVEQQPAPPSLELLGIVAVQSDQVAVLADPLQGTVHRLRSGEEYNGWRVRIVDGRTVELSNGAYQHSLTLFDNFSATPAPAFGGEGPADQLLVVPEPEL